MAKGIANRARSPPSVFDFATSQIQEHGGTKMYYDLVESGKRIKALRKEHGLTQEQLAEQLGVAANTIALAPATGTYSMTVYSVFKDQAADFLWLYLNCTCSSCKFLLPRRYSFEVIHDLKICNQGLSQSAQPVRLPNQ